MTIVVSVLLIGTAVVAIYYWIDFYLKGAVHVIKEDWYIRFQSAFPTADLWMSICAIAGAIGLLTDQTYGVVFSLLAASSMIFLSLMDITFNIQNKLYRLIAASGQMKLELFLNIYNLVLGTFLIVYLSPQVS
jgi:hypothetical protein